MTPRAKAITTLQKLIRLKSANNEGLCQCVTCGLWEHYKDVDAGHFIPKGSSSYWALKEDNIHVQCKGCNGFGMKYGTTPIAYTLYMEKTFGKQFVEDMLNKKNTITKIYKAEYLEMIETWKKEIKIHLERIGDAR